MIPARNILLLTLALTAPGCQWRTIHKPAEFVDPALPVSMSRNELIEHLNRQNQGLQSWQCKDTRIRISMPGVLPQRLSGSLACSAPNQFRLVADGSLVVHTDFGSNDDVCWAYVKPGEPAVMTWRHEDSHLLQYIPGGIPRLEPEWLMTILGVQPLNPEDYELTSAPEGSRELWLVAVEDAPDGSSLRRVIKVDTVTGMAREHALYDSDKNALLRAHLSHHKTCNGHVLPHVVKLDFPQNETQLLLTFTGIETDCRIAENFWSPPGGPGVPHVDLGDYVRSHMQQDRNTRPISHSKPSIDRAWPEAAPGNQARRPTHGPGNSASESPRFSLQQEDAAGDKSFDPNAVTSGEAEADLTDIPPNFETRRAKESSSFDHEDRPDFDLPASSSPRRNRSWLPFWR